MLAQAKMQYGIRDRLDWSNWQACTVGAVLALLANPCNVNCCTECQEVAIELIITPFRHGYAGMAYANAGNLRKGLPLIPQVHITTGI